MSRGLEEDEVCKTEAERTTGCADAPVRPPDKYGLVGVSDASLSTRAPMHPPVYPQACRTKDIDKEFHRRFAKRFSGWQEAVKSASEVLIDEMRTLLECSAQCESVCI